MQNCIIIHGCPSNVEKAMNPETRTHDKHWIPWVKNTLTKFGIPTEAPLMPEPWEPSYEKFKAELRPLHYPLIASRLCGKMPSERSDEGLETGELAHVRVVAGVLG